MKVRIVRGEGFCEIPYEISTDSSVARMCEHLSKVVEEELDSRLGKAGCEGNLYCECDPVNDPYCEGMKDRVDEALRGFHSSVIRNINNVMQGYGGVWKVYDISGDYDEFAVLYAPKRFTDTLYNTIITIEEYDADDGFGFDIKARIIKFVFEEPIDVERLFTELEIEHDLYELIVYGIIKDENDAQAVDIRLAKPLYIYEE